MKPVSVEALATEVGGVWRIVADLTVAGLPDATVDELPRLLNTLVDNINASRPARAGGDTS